MRTFTMERRNDESGVSGTGVVVEGVEFSDGRVALRWCTDIASTTSYDSFEDFARIHVISHPTNSSVIRFSNGEVFGQNKDGVLVQARRVCRHEWPGQAICNRPNWHCVSPDCQVEIFE